MTTIPDKLYFKIGEVAKIAQVEPFVLRYWQKKFKHLRPQQNKKGQRRYTRQDVELVLTIAQLRYQHKYSVEGIKKLLAQKEKKLLLGDKIMGHQHKIIELCTQMRQEAEQILDILGQTSSPETPSAD